MRKISLRVPSVMAIAARTQEGLVRPSTTSDDTDHTTDGAGDDLLGAGGELDTGLALVGVVANDGDVVAGGPAERTAVANLLLDVGDDGTLRNGAEGKDVADGQAGVLAGVDELAGVHALVGNEGLGVELEAVGVAENDLGERSTTAGVVDDVLHDTADVAMALSEVVGPELGGGLVQTGVGREDGTTTFIMLANRFRKALERLRVPLPLVPDNATLRTVSSNSSAAVRGEGGAISPALPGDAARL